LLTEEELTALGLERLFDAVFGVGLKILFFSLGSFSSENVKLIHVPIQEITERYSSGESLILLGNEEDKLFVFTASVLMNIGYSYSADDALKYVSERSGVGRAVLNGSLNFLLKYEDYCFHKPSLDKICRIATKVTGISTRNMQAEKLLQLQAAFTALTTLLRCAKRSLLLEFGNKSEMDKLLEYTVTLCGHTCDSLGSFGVRPAVELNIIILRFLRSRSRCAN